MSTFNVEGCNSSQTANGKPKSGLHTSFALEPEPGPKQNNLEARLKLSGIDEEGKAVRILALRAAVMALFVHGVHPMKRRKCGKEQIRSQPPSGCKTESMALICGINLWHDGS